MQLGVVYPQNELGGDPANLREFALAAERLGYRHLAAYDHVLGADHADRDPALSGPYTEADPFHDPFVLFAYLAGITSLEFVTDVLVLPQRQTALVAKQATDVDLLSGGRLRLGVATGWNHVEFEALGVPFEARGARLDEQIQLLRRLWTDGTITFEGRFHRVTRRDFGRGEHAGHAVADVAGLVAGDRVVGRCLHVRGHRPRRRHRAGDDRGEIGARVGGHHARQRQRARHVDRHDAGVGVGLRSTARCSAPGSTRSSV